MIGRENLFIYIMEINKGGKEFLKNFCVKAYLMKIFYIDKFDSTIILRTPLFSKKYAYHSDEIDSIK